MYSYTRQSVQEKKLNSQTPPSRDFQGLLCSREHLTTCNTYYVDDVLMHQRCLKNVTIFGPADSQVCISDEKLSLPLELRSFFALVPFPHHHHHHSSQKCDIGASDIASFC